MLVAVALLVASLSAAPASPARVPARIDSASSETAKPVWVSAAEAVDQAGTLRRELFEPHQLTTIDAALELGPSGGPCTVNLGAPPLDQFVRLDSLEALVRSSGRIIAGTITGAGQGFLRGVPGTLYSIAVNDSVAAQPVPETTYLFLPIARIETGRGSICMTPPANAMSVAVGDRVLLFVHLPSDGENGVIHVVDPRSQLVAERDGTVHAPTPLKLPAGRRIEGIMDHVRWLRFAEAARRSTMGGS